MDLDEFNGRYSGLRLGYRLRLWAPTSASRAISAVAELLVITCWQTIVRACHTLQAVLSARQWILLLATWRISTNHLEGLKLSAYQISTKYLSPRPRYYYFRFLKTNGRHIEILLPVSILTTSLSSISGSPAAHQLSLESDHPRHELWRHSDFQHGGRQPCWISFRVMVACPRSVSGGLCIILNFRLDRIYTFRDSAIFIFCNFRLKLPIHAHFYGVLGAYFPK